LRNSIFFPSKNEQAKVRKTLILLWLSWGVILFVTACTVEPERNSIILRGADEIRQKNTAFQAEFPDRSSLQAKIRSRGKSSLQYPKKSFRLKVPQPVSICGLPSHKVWILNANYIDKSFIRHRLSFDLFRAMGAHNLSPHGCYLELELNEKYHGLYFVHQRIDRSRCGISKQQPGGVIFKEPPVFIEDEPGAEYPGNRFGQKYPSHKKRNDAALAESMRDFLFYSSDSIFDAEVADHFHLENVADWMLLLLFTNNTDGLLRNFYLYRLHEGLPFRIAIWDYDETFGRFGDNRLNNVIEELDIEQNPLLRRLFERESFRELLKQRWENHRQGALSEEAIDQRIEEYVAKLNPLVVRNFERWPVDGPGYMDENRFAEEVTFIRQFISERLLQLDGEIERWFSPCIK